MMLRAFRYSILHPQLEMSKRLSVAHFWSERALPRARLGVPSVMFFSTANPAVMMRPGSDKAIVSAGQLLSNVTQLKPASFNTGHIDLPTLNVAHNLAKDIRNVYGNKNIAILGNHLHLMFSPRLATWYEDGRPPCNVLHSVPQINFSEMLLIWKTAGWKVVGNEEQQCITIIVPRPYCKDKPMPLSPTKTMQNDEPPDLAVDAPKPS